MGNPDENKSDAEKTDDATKLEERKSEATSDETLSDLRDNEKDSGSSGAKRDPGPSPDGQLDESAEIKDAGPM